MVKLNRIYTKSGDDGTTGLGDGSRLVKHHERIATYGTLDELSSVLGLALARGCPEPCAGWLREIQNDLFDLGSDLCVPGEAGAALRITPAYTARLEELIDATNADLPALASFVLPGGREPAAWLHLARTVCRRAERHLTALMADDADVNPEVLRYLNRLSDLFFVLARALNDGGAADVLWEPGRRKRDAGDA
ncbi:MAG: cob(I)yrinic acid a,c-diamide adenosyltransferase [Planctomycetes bacterium]|nr:cob(I)yrinic acid a,c-diamide adenosyltransferase [Planctomycetota bacterium]